MLFKIIIFTGIGMLMLAKDCSSFALNVRGGNTEDETNADVTYGAVKEADAKPGTKSRMSESKMKEEKNYILTKSKNGFAYQDEMKDNAEDSEKERLYKRQAYEADYLIPDDVDLSRRRAAAAAAARRGASSSAAAMRAAAAAAARRTAALLEESNRQAAAEGEEDIDDAIEVLDSLRQAAAVDSLRQAAAVDSLRQAAAVDSLRQAAAIDSLRQAAAADSLRQAAAADSLRQAAAAASSRNFDDISVRQAVAVAARRSLENALVRQLSNSNTRNSLFKRSEARRQEDDDFDAEPLADLLLSSKEDSFRKDDLRNLNMDRVMNNLRDAMDIYDSLETLRDDSSYRDESIDGLRQAATEVAKEAAFNVARRAAAAAAVRAAAAAASRRYMTRFDDY